MPMKNVLLLSSLYPNDDVKFLNNTAVCHYFAKEWTALGYNVRVIHLYNSFPIYQYPLLKAMNKILASKWDNAVLDKYLPNEHTYTMDGIKITRMPVKKSMPGGTYKDKELTYRANRIDAIIKEENFVPDCILGHFFHPSLEIVAKLKAFYPDAVTTVSLHGKCFKKEPIEDSLAKIDMIGYRCYPIGTSFEKIYGQKDHFCCFSGVPADYIVADRKDYSKGIHNFIYVGNLMKRKHPACLVLAISKAVDSFKLTYVGDGLEKKQIDKLAKELNVSDKVEFTGRIPRNEVVKRVDEADVFIMISKNETFGLVYLEAMARGCIVVASRDEGMDGIIIDGENGFLCNAGDALDLENTIRRINGLSPAQLNTISQKALTTAREMTDKDMAKKYIEAIVNYSQNYNK